MSLFIRSSSLTSSTSEQLDSEKAGMRSDTYLEDDVVEAYILSLSFDTEKSFVFCRPTNLGGHGWSSETADAHIELYKKWLLLVRRHFDLELPPSEEVDAVWHAHMMNTERYHADCNKIFGVYLHHDPSFGSSAEDLPKLLTAFEQTKKLFFAEYGISL